MIRPLSLPLEAGGNGVVTDRFLLGALGQTVVSAHQVLHDQRGFDGEFPVLRLLFGGLADECGVLVKAFGTVFLHPRHGAVELLAVINALLYATQNLDLIDRFHAHTEVILKEIRVDLRAGNAHAHRADLQVGLTLHGHGGDGGSAEAEQLFLHVCRNFGCGCGLDVMPVNAECRQSLLRVRGKDGGKIDRAGALGAVEAPDRLDGVRVHVHGLRAVAPAGCNRQGNSDLLAFEFLRAGGSLPYAPDGGIGNDHTHGRAVGVAEVFCKEFCGALCHIHGLLLERLTHL